MIFLLLLMNYVAVRIRLRRRSVFSTVKSGVIHREELARRVQLSVLYLLIRNPRPLKLDVCAQVRPGLYP